MKKLMILALSAALLTGMSSAVQAIDFKARGEWLMGFGAGDGQFTSDRRIGADSRKTDTDDVLDVRQRVKLQLDAVASESLSGTVIFAGPAPKGQTSPCFPPAPPGRGWQRRRVEACLYRLDAAR